MSYYVFSSFASGYCYYEPPPIDKSIFHQWQDETLRYLWRAVETTCRILFVFHRRSDPRWSRKRWKATT